MANRLVAADTTDWTRKQLHRDFWSQPARVQTETLDRVLAQLVAEYRHPRKVPSPLWKNMDVYGFTESLVRRQAGSVK